MVRQGCLHWPFFEEVSNIGLRMPDALRHDRPMPLTNRRLMDERPRYSMTESVKVRRRILRQARLIPPGHEQDQHRQVAALLRRLFKNAVWRDAHKP
jgi:hypothetical protein